jgi:hypothetical protein
MFTIHRHIKNSYQSTMKTSNQLKTNKSPRHFTKKGITMVSKFMDKCSQLLKQVKATMRYHVKPMKARAGKDVGH